MNTISRAGWVFIVLLCAVSRLSAQKSTLNDDLVKADRQFALYAYNLAMQTYQQVLKEDPRNAHALARIGDCHYQLNNPEKSLEWYQKAIRQYNMEPDVHLRYGKALMQTGDYDGAKDQFLAYAETEEAIGNHYASVCEYAIQNAGKESAWQVKNEALNTEFADFCPTFLNSRVVYNSARTDVVAKAKSSDSPSGAQNYLLVTQRNPESNLLQKPQILRSELQNARNEGPVSFSADGSRVAFCRNNFINGTRQIAETGINMSLYTAEIDDNGKWKNIKAFPFNGSNYATGFPALSPDGNTLIFASTQPGGFGGWDIYVSNYRSGEWSQPRNLGSPLNTAGNEVTPFFDGENLYFSSDWHRGLGGLDVFRAELGREEVSNVYHLGPGVNSARDDYGFVYSADDNVGYVTSTRNGGRGNEDIWRLTKKWDNDKAVTSRKNTDDEEPSRPSQYDTDYGDEKTVENGHHILITDDGGDAVSGAEVDLSDCYGEKGYTDRSGKFQFDELNRAIDCQAVIRKKGFRDAVIDLKKFGKQNIRISLSPESREQFEGRVYDARSKAPVRGVTVSVEYQDGSKLAETETEADGSYLLNLEPGSTYLINYSKYGYVSQISKTYLGSDMGRIPNTLLEKEGEEKQDDYVVYKDNPKPVQHDTDDRETKTLWKKQTIEPIKEPETARGFAIQLAAMPEEPSDSKLRSYEAFTKEANLYVKSENKLNKIRLGVFQTKAEAETVLKKVQASKTSKDAFVVEERDAQPDLVIGAEPVRPVVHSTEEETLTARGKNTSDVLYALQLGSFSSEKAIVVSDYANLRGLGNLYSNTENGYTQVRLGIWQNHQEAENAKNEAIDRGFPKAMIVTEKRSDTDIQDFILEEKNTTASKKAKITNEKGGSTLRPQEYSTEEPLVKKPYFVRIAALSNPDRFDGSSLRDLGTIEKRKAEHSPGMTIILLAGFATQNEAESALEKVLRRGYDSAYVMKEENGKLVRQ